jgi:hypothetical protein
MITMMKIPDYGIDKYSVFTSTLRILFAVLKEDEGLASEKDRKYAFLEFSEFE